MISIIIPVYNHQEALERALVSVQKQTYQDIEIIVVDDGSKKEVQISNYTFPIQCYRQQNAGAPAARNAGFALSKGEYVIFWDADVVAEPEMLEKMVHALQTHSTASFAYANHYFGQKRMRSQQFDYDALMQNNYIHTTSLIRRDAVVKWDESLTRFQDWDFFLTLAEQGKQGVWIDEYMFRVAPGGTMSTWLPKMAYKKPWRRLPWIAPKVQAYEEAKRVVMGKHGV